MPLSGQADVRTVLGEPTYPEDMTLTQRSASAIAWTGIAVVALWVLWGFAPPSLVPPAPSWVEVYLPLAVFGALFPLTVLALRQEKVRPALGGTALVAVTAALVLEVAWVYVFSTAFNDF